MPTGPIRLTDKLATERDEHSAAAVVAVVGEYSKRGKTVRVREARRYPCPAGGTISRIVDQ